ncbi:alginate lyase family protein [Allosphingosinicella deserti]|uniref:alginate lyase family protein n=1 Tax=Allosphingosinicella deserti TaxID=2116704 RepID=UPI0018EBE66D|nr:alginate lyase family protein [Sphingomonas deserti]
MIDRRSLLAAGAAFLATPLRAAETLAIAEFRAIERARVLPRAVPLLRQKPRTITAIPAPRSPAGPHDYYSEGDYWWPDPARPGGPYVRRDGLSNPDKFDGHRDALIAFGVAVPTLTSAWALTGDRRFAAAAIRHLEAWFVTPETRMNPNLAHAQAIIGVNSGRAIGIIDTLQIVEVARAAEMLARRDAPGYRRIRSRVEAWFAAYLDWLTGSPAGREERDQKNNHGTCWLLQVAAFASLLGRADLLAAMRTRLMKTIVPAQIAADGRQPLELARTKPFAYSLFNLDVLAASAWLLSHSRGELIVQPTASGASIADAIAFMAPFIADRTRWPFARDVEHFDDFPVRHPSLLFGALAQDRAEWLALWRALDADPTVAEVVRNYPVRQPLLWMDQTL